MDKKDIYEHLASIYLDASSSKKRKKIKVHPWAFRNLFFGSVAVIIMLGGTLLFSFYNPNPFSSQTALVLSGGPLKINFNFDPAKKEIYSLDLGGLDLNRFSALAFSLKKENFTDNVTLKVEFVDSFNEKSEIYLRDIPHKWTDYKITLARFKAISDWSQMSELNFIVEEWNTKGKAGVVYIDNLKVVR